MISFDQIAMFGPEQPVNLNLIEIETAMGALEEVCMELNDFSKEKIQASVDELNEERVAVSDLL